MRNLISVILSLVLGAGVAYADDLHREGSKHVSGHTGNFPMGVVNENDTALGAEGDYVGLAVTTSGKPRMSIAAGTADIGSLIGNTVTLTSTLTVTATTYEALDLVGGKNTLSGAVRASAGSGRITSVVIADQAAQAGSYDAIYWSADPSATTFTDEAALDVADADLLKIICSIPVTTTTTFSDNGLTSSNNIGCAFEVPSGTSIYMAVVARSTPTFAATTDVQVRTTIEQD